MDEEDWCVVFYYVLVIFFGVKFESEFMRIFGSIWKFIFISYGGKLSKYGCFFIYFIKEFCFVKISYVVGDKIVINNLLVFLVFLK